MKQLRIKTNRKITNWPSWDLVYEWEDYFVKSLNTSYRYDSNMERYFNKFARLTNWNIFSLFPNNYYEFQWDMSVRLTNSSYNRPNLIPGIIDFHLSKDRLADFFSAYRHNPFILISSLEAFTFLKENNFPKKIYHFPLSLPNAYQITPTTHYEKKYDLVLAGRQNPVLDEYLKKYAANNSAFVYVYRILQKNTNDGRSTNNMSFDFYTSKGEFLGNINDRKGYMELIQKSRVSLYATPGIDGGEERTKGFNQVTPRFLELIASGCHIIARYKDNPDTDFYQLHAFCPNINTYEEFEREMDKALQTNVDMQKYADYLENHYTSKKVELLRTILELEGIKT